MARFDVHADKAGQLVVDVRSDILQGLPVLLAIPLLPIDRAPPPIARLNPVVSLDGADYQLMTQLLASVPRREFGLAIGSLGSEWDDITRALDFLFTGF